MKKSRVLFICLALGLLATLALLPALAQEGPGEGGVLIEPNLGGDINTLNPILSNDQASSDVIDRIFPDLTGYDPATQLAVPDALGTMATNWDVSDDGTVYTFHLRDDWNWNDGTPITSADYQYAWDAIASGTTDTPLGYLLDVIESVESPDPQTVVITFKGADCAAIYNAGYVPMVPAHIFTQLFGSDFAAMNNSDWNVAPSVSAFAFQFGEFRPGEQVSVLANQDYPDAQLGYVAPEGWIYKNVPDQTIMLEQFLAGDVTYTQVAQSRQQEFRDLSQERGFQIFEYADNSFVFMAMNAADPMNPQNGVDENGDPIDQGHHPIFGDPRVRQALVMALDMQSIIDGAANGEGNVLASHANPNSWAYNPELQPRTYDQEAALALLAEAGWVDADGDPSTPLVAQGALYAPDGTEFSFGLVTNAGNQVRESVATIVQDQLSQIGVNVDFQAIDFNVAIDQMLSQTFDAVILGWSFSFPDNPDDPTANFAPANDIVGSGYNFTSYNNPEVTDLLDQARDLPGCNPEERAQLYYQVQEKLFEDQPWVWFFQPNVMWAAQADLQNWSPFPGHPNQIRWNLDAMSITP